MELDKETRDKIISTHTTVKFILESLNEGKDKFKEHESKFKECDNRISEIEKGQYLMMGKLSILIIFLGIGMTALINGIIWLWGKITH